MRTSVFVILAILSITACRNKRTSPGAAVIDKSAVRDIAGLWYATDETYALLAKKNYKQDTVFIELRPDSSFKVRLPDCLDAAAKGGMIWDAIGSWKLRQSGSAWKLLLAFEKGRLFRYRTYTDFDILMTDSVLTLARVVGNPDKEEILQFVRAH
ncbi:hypothetical protein [Paraflavitalea sp. CAU 1676]|uniref:hypothetical protein n=1 Tax=Paraflavitalea sp. CAU 1676 TaxID=3032598 RepID=UPI0023DA8DFD|nr:hypothetical protein [Paraflavitalea sp. CAU 1676]MDF2193314.1 hypothetical protein [Paraflavitalea sp. CAU 1676]